jgi:ribonuclease R
VDVEELAVSGFVHISALSQSYVRWHDGEERLEDGRRTWQVGTRLRVQISEVDFDQRKLDFRPVPARGRL